MGMIRSQIWPSFLGQNVLARSVLILFSSKGLYKIPEGSQSCLYSGIAVRWSDHSTWVRIFWILSILVLLSSKEVYRILRKQPILPLFWTLLKWFYIHYWAEMACSIYVRDKNLTNTSWGCPHTSQVCDAHPTRSCRSRVFCCTDQLQCPLCLPRTHTW